MATSTKRTVKRKSTNPRPSKTTRGRKPQPKPSYLGNIIGVVAMLIAIFAVLKLGMLGKFFANLTRYLVGNPYQIFLIALMVPLLGVIAYGRWPSKFKLRYYLGFATAMLGIMLMLTILLFKGLDMHHNFIHTVVLLINQDLSNQAVSTDVGGGVIGAALYSGTYLIASDFGSWLIAIILVIAGIIITFNLDVTDVFATFFNFTAATGKTVESGVQSGLEYAKIKSGDFKERAETRANERKNFDSLMEADPFGKDTPIVKVNIDDIEPTVAVAPNEHASEEKLTAETYKAPTIIAPEPEDEPVSTSAPSAVEAVQSNYEQPAFNAANDVEPAEPVADGSELDSVDSAIFASLADQQEQKVTTSHAKLTHADILGHDEHKTSPKTTAHQSNVGHVEPSSQSVPTADVAISPVDDHDYVLPTTRLLTRVGSTDQSHEREGLAEKAHILHDTLKSFNINADVEKVVLGPTVTQYEIKPAIGVKVSRITNLADDLALALAAKSLRIEAPIPGKSLVGIEVANDKQAMVGFRDMMDSVGVDRTNPLKVPIGKSVSGEVVKMDLAKMPHLLIAGSTGSGKSVAINSILASILLQAKPSEVRLMLVDPKKVELSVYNDIPHLITPVVSDPRKAALALKKVVAEMDRRFKLLAEAGVRNIAGYNKQIDEANNKADGTIYQRMPYLVVVIDELADLMITVAGEVEPAIVRIAQLGRAAGIHLIVATQRPSVDVITGLIKANVPSRMAFAVSSGVDSRTILDSNGAEKLLGRGDMLFAPIGANSPQRLQGAFLSDDDVEALTDFIKRQGTAQYDDSMTVSDEEVKALDGNDSGSDGNRADELDELWDEAVDFVVDQQRASTSLVQRRFRIGYNRAARLVDDMEARGVVGPQDGAKPRRVLVSKEMLYRLKNGENKATASDAATISNEEDDNDLPF
ncbi:cell division protein [Weissella oryzae SG25]|uniref:DNA translocase FtsK n=1 Tax=Weissella oryzae (strain DSM 25784 / JCM 18191 / LMG 30913 / SG25) TaxID=1329250 RepID=A0A069CZ32_WEIOS|nr:DNA translocase FtsK [Weissella oryzae]GAK30301.1 cell division protein [Weissella oryzae SG25]